MIITRKWLERYIDLNKISDEQIISALNSLGFEVDNYHNYDQNTNIVLGRVQVVNPIPDTHLNFCLVDTKGELVDPIVCGASNVAEEMYVVVAKPGAHLANGADIATTNIRGFTSEGMICSLEELGLPKGTLTTTELDEILPLTEDIDIHYENLGTSAIGKMLGLDDASFEVDLTLNRSDGLSAYELARELANYFNRKLEPLELEDPGELTEYENNLKVIIDTNDVNVAVSANIQLQENRHPLAAKKRIWLKMNQYQSDITKPIHDLLAVTTIETGQPLLGYDRQKITGTLKITDNYENKEFGISKGDLVVIDDDQFVELIGVKTNPVYEITSTTTEITILAVNINFTKMRSQQRKVGISNLNLQRYIKPLSAATVNIGLGRFIKLLELHEYLTKVSVINFVKEKYLENDQIMVSLSYLNSLIGHQFALKDVKELLEPLDFVINEQDHNHFVVQPPAMRTDLHQPADIVEEVARLFGYDNIIATPPVVPHVKKTSHNKAKVISAFEQWLLGNGFYQAKTYSLVNDQENQDFNLFGYQNPYRLLSPLSQDHQTMRLSLLNSLLTAVQYNNARNLDNVKLFTIEKIYFNNNQENYHASFVAQTDIIKSNLTADKLANSYYYMKGLLEGFLTKVQIPLTKLTYREAQPLPIFHPYQTSEVYLDDQLLAVIGKVHPQLLANNIDTYFCEINLEVIFNYPHKIPTFFHELNKYSSSTRDISMLIKKTDHYGDLEPKIIANLNHLTNVEVVGQYQGENIADDMRSLTVRFTFNSNDQQLTEVDVNNEYEKIKNNLTKLGITIR
ncbi:phenylalanine--tRNA ligase subunit beta [Spiroplasma sp. DGKH1]|uniref:phenylalanine--tRNA ligase subunit beta n=1 Tax=Spiroplasma sp. DGKH1 TaxID=3050074 RepID=UPI0034C624F6